jgi:hypothetical protein
VKGKQGGSQLFINKKEYIVLSLQRFIVKALRIESYNRDSRMEFLTDR